MSSLKVVFSGEKGKITIDDTWYLFQANGNNILVTKELNFENILSIGQLDAKWTTNQIVPVIHPTPVVIIGELGTWVADIHTSVAGPKLYNFYGNFTYYSKTNPDERTILLKMIAKGAKLKVLDGNNTTLDFSANSLSGSLEVK